jgi:ferredoxin-NADP reductase
MMKKIDEFLNRVTMYRLVVYVLSVYILLGVLFSFLGKLAFTPTEMVVSLVLLLTSAFVTDKGLAYIFNIPSNAESWLITALIIFLIMHPATSIPTGIALLLAGFVSSASKYLITWHKKHIFNPAALAAAFVGLTALQSTTWWIGSSIFWPVTLVLGLAVVRKIRRIPLFIVFTAGSVLLQLVVFIVHGQPLLLGMKGALLASPLLFLGTIMLTEPATMPPRRNQQLLFAGIIAIFYILAFKIGPVNIYPEVAILLGNVYAFVVSPKVRAQLRLKQIQRISDRVYNYVFQPDKQFSFIPGQYMEWTLPGVPFDSRGNRRSFTIASSPTESDVHVGIKYYSTSSAYKMTFAELQVGDVIYASQLAGNFTSSGNEHKKLAFIAGGIGITPFRSMIQYMVDKNITVDIVLLYVVSDPLDFAYVEQLKGARSIGVKTIPLVTDLTYRSKGILTAKLTSDLLAKTIPDYSERIFYVSGSNAMVDGTKEYLNMLQVADANIKTDHFSGY